MRINGEKRNFPIVGKLSFFKVIETLEEVSKSNEEHIAQYAQSFLDEISKIPELIEGTEDLELIENNMDLVSRIMQPLFPPVLTLNEIKGATAPFDFRFFYKSKRLENILKAAGDDFELKITDIDEDTMYIMGCSTILQVYYKYAVSPSKPFVMEIPESSGDIRYYRCAFNADLMQLNPTDKAIDITEDDYWNLINNYHDIDLWKSKFPPDSWEMKGLGLVNLMDITVDHTMNMMTANLLEGANDSLSKVIGNIKSLLRLNDLSISFIRYNKESVFNIRKDEVDDTLMNGEEELVTSEIFNQEEYKILLSDYDPLIVSDVETYSTQSRSFFSQQLNKKKLGSYLLIPIRYNEIMIGFLEIGSKKKKEINKVVMEKLKLSIPIISMAASRFRQEELNHIEAVIQEECTTIHPSVKWRFEKAAEAYIEAEEKGEKAEFKDLIFSDVYPLYGQMDIRSSSSLRNEAVKEDLSQQLKTVKEVLRKAIKLEALPVYEEMLFRVDSYLNEFKNDLIEGSEQRILSFLKTDVYPIFDYLKQQYPTISKDIDDYNNMLNVETNMVYNSRKHFDESVNKTNALLAELIDEKQKDAQKMFPHYFERYKTDGVEYNLYIGQSISEKKRFNPIHLNNLQLWQLKSICEMEHSFYRLRKNLAVPLEVASLILVHNSSLSIHFRIDEKRFDVEGAYNARYEIIKKRVDKAHIKGTDERITAPGKVVIIYTSKEDAVIYERHINYLESKGYLIPNSTEYIELEDLQGVSGLRALRVSVDYSDAEEEINIDDLIETLDKKH